MAAPNIVNVSTITAKTTGAALGTTLTTSLLANSASSGKVFKVNTIIVANVDGTNDATVTLDYYNGTTGYKIANTINVAADTTLIALDKNSAIYLEEGDDSRTALIGSNVISSVNVNEKVGCADPIVEFIKKNNVPPRLRGIYCQQFLNNTFIQNNYSGTSCSAFRFTNPCDSIEYQL